MNARGTTQQIFSELYQAAWSAITPEEAVTKFKQSLDILLNKPVKDEKDFAGIWHCFYGAIRSYSLIANSSGEVKNLIGVILPLVMQAKPGTPYLASFQQEIGRYYGEEIPKEVLPLAGRGYFTRSTTRTVLSPIQSNQPRP